MKLLLALLLLASAASAEPNIVFLNKCADIDQVALANAKTQAEVSALWHCFNRVQSAQKPEIRRQVNRACRGIKCPTIYSIDPKAHGRYNEAVIFEKQTVWYEYGAWTKKGKIYFAAMNECNSAIPYLRRAIHDIRREVLKRAR